MLLFILLKRVSSLITLQVPSMRLHKNKPLILLPALYVFYEKDKILLKRQSFKSRLVPILLFGGYM